MPIIKTNHNYDLDRCLVEWELIQLRLGDKLWDSDKVLGTGIHGQNRQTCLQRSNKSVVNPYTDGAGARREWTISRWQAPKAKKKSIIKDQSEYKILNEAYEGTVFADIIQDVNGERARIMEMNPSTTYTVHRDNSPRYHLALITNPNAYFLFPTLNEIIHIPADGCLYEVDTTILHSFVNCGPDRTHLVISKRSSS
tara:strand:+ start:109 stop:699 length:591 start_codon:yes stop_codon:yes gene_type:complete